MKTLIKSANGSTRGFTVEQTHRINICSPEGKILGFYDKHQDKTYSASGTCVGYGNQLVCLLED